MYMHNMLIFVTYRFDLGHEFSILLLSQPQFMENLSYFLQKKKGGHAQWFHFRCPVNYSTSYGLKSWILHKDIFEYLLSYMILCLRYIHGSFNFKWMVKAMEIASNNYHLKSEISKVSRILYIYHNNNSCVVETTKQLGMKKINKFKFHKSQGHWKIIWSLILGPVKLIETPASWLKHLYL